MIDWALGGLEMYKNRQDLKDIAKGGLDTWLGKKTSIAITGMAGVGKTVLSDHLTGRVHQRGYRHPLQSQSAEKGKLIGKKRIAITVVPGQPSEPRSVTLDELFNAKDPAHGVIHVVSNGLATKRTDARTVLIEAGYDTIEKLQAYQLEEELEDLEETCEEIIRSHHKHRHPKWMIVAVDKIDLYQNELEVIRKTYSPMYKSAFSKIVNKMRERVGTEFLRWETIPVSATLERFEWNGQTLSPSITETDRDAYLIQLLDNIRNYCQ